MRFKNKYNKLFFVLLVSLVLLTSCSLDIIFLNQSNNSKSLQECYNDESCIDTEKSVEQIETCNLIEEEVIVRGDSLTGVVENDDIVKLLKGFYDCNIVQRDDIIVYDYAGNDLPIIKIVKGLPGDTIELKESNLGWNVIINDEVLESSETGEYELRNVGMLSLYVEGYEGVIPEDSYLIFGTSSTGTLDSTRFGFIHKDDIIGKIIIE